MLNAYRAHVAERATLGIPPLPLDAKQTAELIELNCINCGMPVALKYNAKKKLYETIRS